MVMLIIYLSLYILAHGLINKFVDKGYNLKIIYGKTKMHKIY